MHSQTRPRARRYDGVMNRALLPLLLAVCIAPSAAAAQMTTPPPAPAMSPAPAYSPMPRVRRGQSPYMMQMERHAMMATMMATRQQLAALHKQTRTNALAALTPAHRNAVANIIGQLAMSANPDPKAAVAKIDATLSGSEKSAILKIVADAHSKGRAIMQKAHAQIESTLPADERARIAQMHATTANASMKPKHHRAQDAGRILFALATNRGGHGMAGMRGMARMHRMRGMMPGMMGPGMMGPGGMQPGGMGPGGMPPGGMRRPMGAPPPVPTPSP